MASDVREAAGIRPAAIAAWFSHLGIAFSGSLRFERIGLGQSNLTYLVRDAADARWVLRRPPLGRLLASGHDVAREARILSALQRTAVPAPLVYGQTADPLIAEVPLVLMQYVAGLVVDRMAIARSLSPARRREIGLSLPRTLAAIHEVDVAGAGLGDLASGKPYAQRQLKRWSAQWELSKTRDMPELDDLTRRLTAAIPRQQRQALVHGDFHLRNVITSPNSGAVAAVLDWELSTLGDPLADVGSMLAYWTEPGEEAADDFPASALTGFPDRGEMSRAYAEASGSDLAALEYWHSLGLWKLAIISQGVLRRALDEPANKAAAGTPTAARVDSLVRKARAVAGRAGL
jgi:aminoglycoside phosphotransferase (APT) family kinase protein